MGLPLSVEAKERTTSDGLLRIRGPERGEGVIDAPIWSVSRALVGRIVKNNIEQ
jgi:hypothetical protein